MVRLCLLFGYGFGLAWTHLNQIRRTNSSLHVDTISRTLITNIWVLYTCIGNRIGRWNFHRTLDEPRDGRRFFVLEVL